jgi:hypothetical protein
MKKSLCLLIRTLVVALLVLGTEKATAAEVPKSPERLREAATHIVTGEIISIESRSRFSTIERGGVDYDIQCSLAVEGVEKGQDVKPGDLLVANCFRPKSRLSILQSFSLQGHSPVPAAGQKVRAYLVSGRGMYYVVHPNGFAPANSGGLIEAREVAQLSRRNPLFTFLLPLELWALIALGIVPAAVVLHNVPKHPFQKAFRWVLAGIAALFTAGLIIGVLEFLMCT